MFDAVNLRSLLHHVLNFILPAACEACATPLAEKDIPCFCQACWAGITPITGPMCPICGAPDQIYALTPDPETYRCRTCEKSPPSFHKAIALYPYDDVLALAIKRFKYGNRITLARPLGHLLSLGLSQIPPVDLVLPVPLHIAKLRAREFNQSLALARIVAERIATPLSFDNLTRTRPTPPQTTVSWKERHHNVKQAFAVRRPSEVERKRLLLIDDVMTTGATINECAKTLRQAGAHSVFALALARTIRERQSLPLPPCSGDLPAEQTRDEGTPLGTHESRC